MYERVYFYVILATWFSLTFDFRGIKYNFHLQQKQRSRRLNLGIDTSNEHPADVFPAMTAVKC